MVGDIPATVDPADAAEAVFVLVAGLTCAADVKPSSGNGDACEYVAAWVAV